jgi:ubiquinone/menaquinone biosynthesis C-methylase UbiE
MERDNAGRFTGFSDVYDEARPRMPLYPVEAIIKYLGREPERVVDLGCGTGLSTIVWKGHCKEVIVIEPSGDMLAEAMKKKTDGITFKKAYSHETGLPDEFADAVVCSQSFHWMEPKSTLAEVNRILRPGGVFATVDCDWPPFCGLEADMAFEGLFDMIAAIEKEYPDIGSRHKMWNKNRHLENIRNSGYFRFAREIVFSNREKCTAERFVKIAQSQGALQNILKQKRELIEKHFEAFKKTVFSAFGDGEFDIDFGYRMRIAVK